MRLLEQGGVGLGDMVLAVLVLRLCLVPTVDCLAPPAGPSNEHLHQHH